jgi:hypothetical protein
MNRQVCPKRDARGTSSALFARARNSVSRLTKRCSAAINPDTLERLYAFQNQVSDDRPIELPLRQSSR